MSAPEASCAFTITGGDEYLPVPTIRRDEKVLPAITKVSMVERSRDILTHQVPFNSPRPVLSADDQAIPPFGNRDPQQHVRLAWKRDGMLRARLELDDGELHRHR